MYALIETPRYAARLVTGCPLTVLCGTVFNHILLWTVDTDMTFDPSVRAPVRLSLLGHEVCALVLILVNKT